MVGAFIYYLFYIHFGYKINNYLCGIIQSYGKVYSSDRTVQQLPADWCGMETERAWIFLFSGILEAA
jgi:hypothetical protein